MKLLRRAHRACALCCTALLLATTVLPAHASLVGTGAILTEARADTDRAGLLALLDRDEVRAELVRLGVDPAEARQRVERMTDAEIAELRAHLDELPAGAGPGTLVHAALVVFIVFVVTDMLGATDIFPFIRPIR